MSIKHDIEQALLRHSIKPTPNRILVSHCLIETGVPMSMTEIEDRLETLNKSSVFRVLVTLTQNNLVHSIDDGSGSVKYEWCRGEGGHTVHDMHAHFRCEKCNRIYCIESQQLPEINLPEGFTPHTVNYVITGLCPTCT